MLFEKIEDDSAAISVRGQIIFIKDNLSATKLFLPITLKIEVIKLVKKYGITIAADFLGIQYSSIHSWSRAHKPSAEIEEKKVEPKVMLPLETIEINGIEPGRMVHVRFTNGQYIKSDGIVFFKKGDPDGKCDTDTGISKEDTGSITQGITSSVI